MNNNNIFVSVPLGFLGRRMNIFDATVRVSKIMEQRYGCSVEFHYYNQEAEVGPKSSIFEIIERNFGAQFVIAQGQIVVPIYIDEKLFGSVVVKENSQINPDDFEEIQMFIDTTLKDFIIKKESLRRLKIEESCLNAVFNQTNVVPMIRNKFSLYFSDDTQDEKGDNQEFLTIENKGPFGQALFLTGGDYSQTREIAFDIHSLLKRNSFVPYSVLDFKSQLFSENLPGLGRVTIFIPEILDLSPKEREQVFEYIHNYASKKFPFLILSTQKSLSEIEAEKLLDPQQLEQLKGFHMTLASGRGIKDFCSLLLQEGEPLN